jgi:hypothetical protein
MSKEERKRTNGHHFGPAVIIEAHSHSEVGVVKSEVSPGMESVLALPWFQAPATEHIRPAGVAFHSGITCTLRVPGSGSSVVLLRVPTVTITVTHLHSLLLLSCAVDSGPPATARIKERTDQQRSESIASPHQVRRSIISLLAPGFVLFFSSHQIFFLNTCMKH